MSDKIRGLQHHLEATEESVAILKTLMAEGRVSSSELKERLSIPPGLFRSCIMKLSSYEIIERDRVKERINGKQTYVSYWNIKSELINTVKRYVGGDST